MMDEAIERAAKALHQYDVVTNPDVEPLLWESVVDQSRYRRAARVIVSNYLEGAPVVLTVESTREPGRVSLRDKHRHNVRNALEKLELGAYYVLSRKPEDVRYA